MSKTVRDRSMENQLVSFKLGSQEYGVDIVKVQEIIKVPEVTRVPKAPDYIEGVVNLRGTILPIIDTRKRFGMETIDKRDSTRIIVADINDMIIGMVVDSVSEVIRIDSDSVEPPPSVITNSQADYLRGIGKLNNGRRLISLLELEKILDIHENVDELSKVKQKNSRGMASVNSERKLEQEIQLVSFQIGSEEYGIEIDLVDEIIRIPEITIIPDMPHYVEGVISLRGRVLPIVNLRSRFGMMDRENDERSRILVIQPENVGKNKSNAMLGIIVDVVNEVLSIPVSAIEPPSELLAGTGNNNLKGIGKLNSGNRLVLQLNTNELFNAFSAQAVGSDVEVDSDLSMENLEDVNTMDERQLVNFKIGNEEFGINIMNVKEIIRMTSITEIPGVPYYVEGVVNLRANVLPVLDLRKRFGIDSGDKSDSNRIVVVNHNDTLTGIIVDSVSEVLQIPEKNIEPPPPVVSGIEADYIEGIGKLDNGDRFVIILKLNEILGLGGGGGDDGDGMDFFDEPVGSEVISDSSETVSISEPQPAAETSIAEIVSPGEEPVEFPAEDEPGITANIEDMMTDLPETDSEPAAPVEENGAVRYETGIVEDAAIIENIDSDDSDEDVIIEAEFKVEIEPEFPAAEADEGSTSHTEMPETETFQPAQETPEPVKTVEIPAKAEVPESDEPTEPPVKEAGKEKAKKAAARTVKAKKSKKNDKNDSDKSKASKAKRTSSKSPKKKSKPEKEMSE